MSEATPVKKGNGLAKISLILGILTIVPGCLLSILGSLIGLAAIITGVIALVKIGQQGTTGKGLAIAGIAIGAIGAILAPTVGTIALLMILGPTIRNTFETINNSLGGQI